MQNGVQHILLIHHHHI